MEDAEHSDVGAPFEKPTEAMVRAFFGLPPRPHRERFRGRHDHFEVPIHGAGGIVAHRRALTGYLRGLLKEDLFHTVDLSIARRPECRVWVGIHFAEGEVLQVAGFREVFEPDLVSALAALGFEKGSKARMPDEWWLYYVWPGPNSDTHELELVADRAFVLLELLGLEPHDELIMRVYPMRPMVTLQDWIDDFLDEPGAELIINDRH